MTAFGSSNPNPSDPFMRFWSEMMSNMAGAGAAPAATGPMPEETMRQMRQAFFDAWSRSCEEYMRSEAFLSMMKDSMDGALAFRKQMNDFLNKALNEGQMPTRTDMETIKFAVRRMEDRVLDRVEDLSRRVAALEGKVESNGAARPVKRGSKGVKDQS
jgi:hypothetical protein